ncbi:hypothetical protein CPB84DRAFT_1795595 [Gymnopilus junonius]|uniref:Uncharacterized protein n=1 Tax=Gymnopilus junonius TaxID=109634 RepID=A0A9P5THT6_GYMJU|nr:hypothetical protein CPB84DRAFT_1795595 [Gymnopilus junonius]
MVRLKLTGVEDPIDLLDKLSLPNLKDLEIGVDHPFPRYPAHKPQALQDFVERSRCRLSCFKIVEPRFTNERMKEYHSLSFLRDVEFVAVLRKSVQDDLWKCLSP